MNTIKFPMKDGYSDKPKVIALGKFETLHLGHRKLISKAREIADDKGYELIYMFFSERPKDNMISLEERKMLIANYRPDYIMLFEPTKENFSFSYEEFNNFLKDINVKEVVAGSDFRYGTNREGDINTLEVFDTTIFEKDDFHSTSNLYNAIQEQDFIKYKDIMGHYFFYKGEVMHGKGYGKKFGTPTANVEYPSYKINIGEGIYFSYAIYDGNRMPSLTSISTNPTIGENKVTYETYIYNFDKDIYGENIYVEIVEKFRDPIKFENIEKLIEQLELDKKRGKEYFDIQE